MSWIAKQIEVNGEAISGLYNKFTDTISVPFNKKIKAGMRMIVDGNEQEIVEVVDYADRQEECLLKGKGVKNDKSKQGRDAD